MLVVVAVLNEVTRLPRMHHLLVAYLQFRARLLASPIKALARCAAEGNASRLSSPLHFRISK
jgi:hypothetical protein